MKSLFERFGVIFLTAFLFLSSSSSKKFDESKYFQRHGLHGVVKVNDTLFCDKTEIANIHWREYVFWISRVFGKESKQYADALPDTLVWNNLDKPLTDFSEHYYRQAQYNDYPLVGVTHQQALAFSKWRSDRVFERFLIDNKRLKAQDDANAENYFTIEKYYSGKLKEQCIGDLILFYPEYRLPSLEERKLLLSQEATTAKIHQEKCKNKNCQAYHGFVVAQNNSLAKHDHQKHIVVPVSVSFEHKSKNAILNLRGNVAEWSNQKNIAFGGGWKDDSKRIFASDTFYVEQVNAWTGFRNIACWRKHTP